MKRLSSYIVLPFLISACAHIPPPVEKPKVPSLDGKAILQRVELHKAKTTSFQGTARVEFRRGGEKFSGKQEIVAQAPSSLAVETVSPFGTMVSLLIASPEKLSFYEADQHRLFQGKPIKTHLSQLFPIYLDVKDVVNIILYQPQIIPCQRSSVEYRAETNRYYLLCHRKQAREEFLIDPTDFFIWQQESYEKGKLVRRISYSDLKQVGEILYPYKVIVEFPGYNSSVAYKFTEIELNEVLEEGLFQMPELESVQLVPLGS